MLLVLTIRLYTRTTTVEVPAIDPSPKYPAPSSGGQHSCQGEAHLQH
jgi:hypothetical protein